jgi:hypothetical protein
MSTSRAHARSAPRFRNLRPILAAIELFTGSLLGPEHLYAGAVTKTVVQLDRERALADLGLGR